MTKLKFLYITILFFMNLILLTKFLRFISEANTLYCYFGLIGIIVQIFISIYLFQNIIKKD